MGRILLALLLILAGAGAFYGATQAAFSNVQFGANIIGAILVGGGVFLIVTSGNKQ